MDQERVVRPPMGGEENSKAAAIAREFTGRERIMMLADMLEREAFQLRKLVKALPEEMHWEANQALVALVARAGRGGL